MLYYCRPNSKDLHKTLVKKFKELEIEHYILSSVFCWFLNKIFLIKKIINTNLKRFNLILYCEICASIRPFEWYKFNDYHVIESWCKLRFSRNTQKHVL